MENNHAACQAEKASRRDILYVHWMAAGYLDDDVVAVSALELTIRKCLLFPVRTPNSNAPLTSAAISR